MNDALRPLQVRLCKKTRTPVRLIRAYKRPRWSGGYRLVWAVRDLISGERVEISVEAVGEELNAMEVLAWASQ